MRRQVGKQNLLDSVRSGGMQTYGALDNVLRQLFGRDDAHRKFMQSHEFLDATLITDRNVAGVIMTVKQLFTQNQCLQLTNQKLFVPRYFGSEMSSINDQVAVEYSDGQTNGKQRQQVNVIISKMADYNRKNSLGLTFQIDDSSQKHAEGCSINLLNSETFEVDNPQDSCTSLKKTGSVKLNSLDLDFGDVMLQRNSRTLAGIPQHQFIKDDESSSDLDIGLCRHLRDGKSTDTFDDFTLAFASTIRQQNEQKDKKGHYNIKRGGRK